jgi:starch-binding outer membrane protein, SusD/RagB family
MLNKTIYLLLFFVIMSCCKKVLEKEDLTVMQDQAVWKDPVLLTSFVNSMYVSLPAWQPVLSDYTDESYGRNIAIDGTLTPENYTDQSFLWYWPYGSIRNMNLFFQNTANNNNIPDDLKKRLSGEVYFLRAFQYFEMVKRYGGVPIITNPQLITDDIYLPRNSTTESFNFILSDLDEAIELLPVSYAATADLGRATKLAAMAMKGRVLLFKASEQFNTGNDIARWQAAYTANKDALTALNAGGYGLHSDYAKMFLEEMNKEVVFAIRFANPGRTHNRDAAVRPISIATNATGGNHPTQELVDAYPMKDGSDPDLSVAKEQQWTNRDARFDATIVYNGASYFGRPQYTYKNSGVDAYGAPTGSRTGYYSRKAINQNFTIGEASTSGTDFIDMRYAEVLMNLAEAANETGNTIEAYDVLKQIRQRAQIMPGANGLYGLKPGMTQAEMRTRIQKERFVEFPFEQKRFWDLRRWKLLETLNGKTRHGYVGTAVSQNPLTFTYETINLDAINGGNMVIRPNIYYLPITRSELQNNPNILQTKNWENGTFDPVL